MVEIFPVVLRHQAKQGQKGPSKGVKAGVAIVGVPSCLQTFKPIWTLSVKHEGHKAQNILKEINKHLQKVNSNQNHVEQSGGEQLQW